MIPSRGLHALRSVAPHARIQTRSFTIARTSIRSSQPRLAPSLSLPTRPTSALTLAISRRHASTTPSSQPAVVTNASPITNADTISRPVTATNSGSLPNIDTITLDDIDFSSPGVPTEEGIGYLKDIGLDYGFGPTGTIEWIIEHLHITAGLPWWGAIAAAAVSFRLLTFPLFIRAAHSSAKSIALHSVFDPIQQRAKQFQKEGNSAGAAAEMRNMMAVRKKAGIRFTDMLLPAVTQGIIGFCSFKLLRAMSALPVPGLKDGGFLWLSDLTVPDGFLIIPAALAISTHFMIKLGGETGSTATMDPTVQKMLVWGLPTLIFLVTVFQPGALCVWFGVSGFMGLLQTLTLQSNTARGYLGLPPIYRKPKPAVATGSSSFATAQESQGYVRPQYQAPSLRTTHKPRADTKIIDTTLAKPAKTTPQKSSVLDQVKEVGSSLKTTVNKYTTDNIEKRRIKFEAKQKEEAIKKAFERRRQG